MTTQSSGSFVSFVPPGRERRARRHRLAAVVVIVAVASSSYVLQTFYSGHPHVPGTTDAFSYFPN